MSGVAFMLYLGYPQGFIDHLVLESDKELARNNKLSYKNKVFGFNYIQILTGSKWGIEYIKERNPKYF